VVRASLAAGLAVTFVALAYVAHGSGRESFAGLRAETLKVLRSVHALAADLAGLDAATVAVIGLAGSLAAAVAGGWLAWQRGAAAGVLAALAIQAVAGRTFFQAWYVAPLVLVAAAARIEGRPLARGDLALLVWSACAPAGCYGVLIAAGGVSPAMQALSLAVALLPPALVWLLPRRGVSGRERPTAASLPRR
jgi:hypothetical protein